MFDTYDFYFQITEQKEGFDHVKTVQEDLLKGNALTTM